MSTLFADYQNERQAFDSLFQPDCQKQLLMFCGESGSGKTSLLQYCRGRVPKSVAHVPIQLRGSAVSVVEIFHRSGGFLK
jgi:putative ribosome biogenesis GTPase RsgA